MVKTYVKRPVEIQAVQWDGCNREEIKEFTGEKALFTDEIMQCKVSELIIPTLVIQTLEGDHIAYVGDYIVRGANGEFYPCKPDIFKQVYEEACSTNFSKSIHYYFNEDRCVCCGRIIPEGQMVCDICDRKEN